MKFHKGGNLCGNQMTASEHENNPTTNDKLTSHNKDMIQCIMKLIFDIISKLQFKIKLQIITAFGKLSYNGPV